MSSPMFGPVNTGTLFELLTVIPLPAPVVTSLWLITRLVFEPPALTPLAAPVDELWVIELSIELLIRKLIPSLTDVLWSKLMFCLAPAPEASIPTFGASVLVLWSTCALASSGPTSDSTFSVFARRQLLETREVFAPLLRKLTPAVVLFRIRLSEMS